MLRSNGKPVVLFTIMVNKKMTISAKPRKISQFIIFSIFIDVVNNNHFFVRCFAQYTYLRNLTAFHRVLIRIFPVLPVWMFLTNKSGIPPTYTAGKATKKLPAFCFVYCLKRSVYLYFAN